MKGSDYRSVVEDSEKYIKWVAAIMILKTRDFFKD